MKPTRVAAPSVAGSCHPADFLTGARLSQHERLNELIAPEEQWPKPLPSACHMVSVEDERCLRRKLIECMMARLIPETEAPRDC